MFPTDLNIELTTHCNKTCYMCPNKELEHKKDMPDKIFEMILVQARELPIKTVSLSGLGESTLYPYLQWAINEIRKTFPESIITHTTNGLQYLHLENINQVIISVNEPDFPAEVFENAKRYKADKHPTYARYILTEQNKQHLEKFKIVWGRRSISVIPVELENWGIYDFAGLTTKKAIPRYPCPALWYSSMVSVDGDIFPCCQPLADRENSPLCLGNIAETTLKEAFESKKYLNLREMHMLGLADQVFPCKNCDFWSSMKKPEES